MPDIKIITRNAETGVLTLGLPTPNEFVGGIDKLVQSVVLLFLNNGRRSIFAPGRTGGMRALLGSNYDPEDPSELFADIRIVISQTEEIILKEQVRTNRPPSERLARLQLVDVESSEEGEANVIVGVINEEQVATQAIIGVP